MQKARLGVRTKPNCEKLEGKRIVNKKGIENKK